MKTKEQFIAALRTLMVEYDVIELGYTIDDDGVHAFLLGLFAHPTAVDKAEVARIAAHIGNAVEYIEKAYPGTKTLDAGPILRNMRRWSKKLAAALQPATEGENNGR